MGPAVVLCSGGLNSSVLASAALHEYDRVALLHVHFGHRAATRELNCFESLVARLKPAEHLVVEMPHIQRIGGNGRTDTSRDIPAFDASAERLNSIHAPGYMMGLVSAGFQWASALRFEYLLLGHCEHLGPPMTRTSSVWPEYSREFIHTIGHLCGTASNQRLMEVAAPYIDMSRSDVVRLGGDLKVPFEETWSCLASNDEPCSKCPNCATRSRAFISAAVADPLMLHPTADGDSTNRATSGQTVNAGR